MSVGVMKWPGGPYIAARSQQGWKRGAKCIVLGPVQINWAADLRVYVTWPVSVCVYVVRGPQGHPPPVGTTEGD